MIPATPPLQPDFRVETTEVYHEFAHPPLIEVWLGVEFREPAEFLSIDAGEWRQRLGPEWSSWRLPVSEPHHAPGMTHLSREVRNLMNDRAIRLSEASISFGWLGYDGSIYPRYEAIRDGFVATLDAIRDLVPQLEAPRRSTVSYLNKIPRGTVWSNGDDWSFFRLWQPNPLTRFKVQTDGFAALWEYPLDACQGTFDIELTHEPVPENSADTESLWLRLTACCATDPNESSLFDALDYGRDLVVRSFNDLVANDAKEFWGVSTKRKPSSLA